MRLGDVVHDISHAYATPGAWLHASVGRVQQAIEDLIMIAQDAPETFVAHQFDAPPGTDRPHWLAPVLEQDVWAAGVTYERSLTARQMEAIDGGDIYARVYTADRPELFFKAHGRRLLR